MNYTSKVGGWVCPLCKKNFKTRKLYYKHKKEEHQDKKRLDEKDTRICCYCQKSIYTTKEVYYNTNICVARIQIKKFILTIGAEQKSLKNNIQNL